MVKNYLNRVSGPLFDRIDVQVEMTAVPFKDLSADTAGPSSAELRQGVEAARSIQEERLVCTGLFTNTQLICHLTRQFFPLAPERLRLIKRAIARIRLSARSYTRILKLARTIASPDASPDIDPWRICQKLLDIGVWTAFGG